MNYFFLAKLITIIIFSIILSFQDFKTQKISWILILLCGFITLAIEFAENKNMSVLVYLFQGTVFFLIYFLVRFFTDKKLGWGDVFYGALQGVCQMWNKLYICLIIEVVLALIYYLIFVRNKDKRLPFIPFMSLGLILSFLF